MGNFNMSTFASLSKIFKKANNGRENQSDRNAVYCRPHCNGFECYQEQ
jgi:hypothetical protein